MARAAGPLFEKRFQILPLEVSIVTSCAALDQRLDYLAQDARQDFAVTGRLQVTALLEDKAYRILEEGRELAVRCDPDAALDFLYSHCYERANTKLPAGTVMLHAACGRLAGKRFLLIGDSGTGKTTLILQLAALGVAVEGDEIAVVMPGGIAALPRRFHVKSRSLTELPWLPPGSERQPFYESGPGSYVFAVSPRALGYDWEIRHSPIDAVFYLEANHGGQPRLEELARYRMVELAMQQLRLPDARDRSWLAPLCAALNHATAHRLIVGRLDKTAELLIRKLAA
ncbi:MAG TPA: hypothetical protein VGJ31_02655 [Dongiaceae bacterium]